MTNHDLPAGVPSPPVSGMNDQPSRPGMAERLGLHRPELRAWAMYDWANSAFMTTIVAAVFPIYFATVAAADLPRQVATFRFGIATTLALSIVALTAPILGAIADYSGIKKRLLALFQAIGVIATTAMLFIYEGDWLLALALFVLANIGVYGAFTFYDSLLPHVAKDGEMDRVSTAGYALGYLGGGLLLAVNLAWIQLPETFGLADAGVASRLSFLSVAIWWVGFSIPLFRRVPEPKRRLEADERVGLNPVRVAFTRLGETFREIRRYRDAFLMLLAFLVYNDGINTIIRMATIFGTEIGIARGHLITALLMVQFVGVPFAFLFGRIASRIGAKTSIFATLAVYTVISTIAYFMTSAVHFYLLALLVATVQGGSQALSRSLFASMVPRHKSSEFFGFFGVFEKFAGIFGPLIFALTVRAAGSSRYAILSVVLFFIVGAAVLARVDVAEGQRTAREIDRAASRV